MTDNTPIANPATNQRAWKPRLGRGWRTLFPTLTMETVGDETTGKQRRSHGTHWSEYTFSLPIPKWMPPAEVLVKAIHFAWFQIIISFYVHLFLCGGGSR